MLSCFLNFFTFEYLSIAIYCYIFNSQVYA